MLKTQQYDHGKHNKPSIHVIDRPKKKRSSKRISSIMEEDDNMPLALLAYRKGYRLSYMSTSSTAVDPRIQSLLSTESSSCSHVSLIKPSPSLVTNRPKHAALEGNNKKKRKKPRPRPVPVTTEAVKIEPPPLPSSKKKKKLSFSIFKNSKLFSSIRKLLVR